MSLINDALKKAQRERGETPSVSNAPMPGGGSATSARASAKSGSQPNFLLLGAGVLLGVVVAVAAVLWLRPASTPATAPAPATVASAPRPTESPAPTPASASATQSPAAVTATTAAATPAKPVEFVPTVKTEPTVVASATPTPAPSPVAPTVEPAAPATTAPAPTTAAPVHSGPPAPSARMVEAIEGYRVTGIRAGTGADAKVLMNDRVFRLGDTVDHSLGIKLIAATPNSLTFRDAAGATYTRNF